MAWNNLIAPHAITSRRRVVASALMYGLSLTVRFTSATGEETDNPAQATQKRRSHEFHHDQRRCPYLQELAPEVYSLDRLSTGLAAQFQKLPRGM